jgi:hypothetical protein
MAYGFTVKCGAEGNFAIMDMVADIKRKVKVYERDDMYRAEILNRWKASLCREDLHQVD